MIPQIVLSTTLSLRAAKVLMAVKRLACASANLPLHPRLLLPLPYWRLNSGIQITIHRGAWLVAQMRSRYRTMIPQIVLSTTLSLRAAKVLMAVKRLACASASSPALPPPHQLKLETG